MPDRIMSYLPPYYEDVLEFVQIGQTEGVELDQLEVAVKQLFADQFVLTSGVQAIKRRELMLGIQADPATETLEFRKQRILNRYRTKPPFTVRWLQEQLDTLVGPGMTVVSINTEAFIMYVTTNIENSNVFKEVQHTVQTVKPANIVYQQKTYINSTIGLAEHIIRRGISWNYGLDNDTWKLGEESFATLEAEVEVK